jgi:hypothetical protein
MVTRSGRSIKQCAESIPLPGKEPVQRSLMARRLESAVKTNIRPQNPQRKPKMRPASMMQHMAEFTRKNQRLRIMGKSDYGQRASNDKVDGSS